MNKPTVIDLFAGAGGFGLGFKLAGYDVVFSLEIDKWAVDTLHTNNPNMVVVQDDIRNYQSSTEIGSICQFAPDIVIGGPPCQGFSIAGPAKKDPKDPRNSLFKNFAYWVNYLYPQIFIMENVKGLLSRKNANREPVIDIISKTFVDLGYQVEVWILNSAEYGVPQTRERMFIVGNRTGIEKINPPPVTHISNKSQTSMFSKNELSPIVSLWDAISDLPELEAGQGDEKQLYTNSPVSGYQLWARGKQDNLYNHVAMKHSKRLIERFKQIGWGESSADVPLDYMPRTRNGNGKLSETAYDQNNRRLYPYKPSHTVAASFYANFIHPFQHRNITAREGARIQSFPDNYKFMGKKTVVSHKLLHREGRIEDKHLCQYNQIGNAVPPLLAKSIGEHIKRLLKC
jgi:DNA (cytosine-5)-methyltransferase 1